MFRFICATLALLVCTIASAQGNNSSEGFRVHGVGAQSCGKWLALREAKNGDEFAFLSYIMGYVDATSAAYTHMYPEHKVIQFDSYALTFWVDKYCRDNPTALVAVAAVTFAREEHIKLNPPKAK